MSIRRIATLTRLSPATVSLALQNNPKIPSATRARVHAAANQINYRPDAKVAELMSQVRHAARATAAAAGAAPTACLGVISLYDTPRPWEKSLHLARMYEGMAARAAKLGYRLEPLWLRAPGMTPRRFRAILDARGINALLCFGSPEIDARFPPELDHYAIVTQGLSIATPLHCVINHAYSDTLRALNRAHALGYRRPGLLLSEYEDIRGGRANAGAYFAWCEHHLGTPAIMPILRMTRIDEKPLRAWLKRHAPDVIIIAHHQDALADFARALQRLGQRAPADIGLIALTQVLAGTPYSGFQENQRLMGERAVELLVSRIMNADFALPENPRIELVKSDWIEGKTLRPQQ